MASSINAATAGAGGVITSADNSGILNLQSGGVTIATINSTGIVMASTTAPLFSVTCSAGTSLPNATDTKLAFNTIVYDTNSNFSTANNRFTPTVAGYYQFNGSFFLGTSAATRPILTLKKNGTSVASSLQPGSSLVGGITQTLSYMVYANGSTDYFELWGYQDSGGTVSTNNGATITYFQGFLARSA